MMFSSRSSGQCGSGSSCPYDLLAKVHWGPTAECVMGPSSFQLVLLADLWPDRDLPILQYIRLEEFSGYFWLKRSIQASLSRLAGLMNA